MATITEYIKILENLEPEDRYGFFLEKGTKCQSTEQVTLTPDNFVKGPVTDVWVIANETPVGWEFKISGGSNRNLVDDGISCMVCDVLDGLSTDELNNVVWKDFVELGELLTKNDKQLIQAVLNKCKELSRG